MMTRFPWRALSIAAALAMLLSIGWAIADGATGHYGMMTIMIACIPINAFTISFSSYVRKHKL